MSNDTFLITTRMGMVAVMVAVTVLLGMVGLAIPAAIVGFATVPVWAIALGNALYRAKNG